MRTATFVAWSVTGQSVWSGLLISITPLDCSSGMTCPNSLVWQRDGESFSSGQTLVQPEVVPQSMEALAKPHRSRRREEADESQTEKIRLLTSSATRCERGAGGPHRNGPCPDNPGVAHPNSELFDREGGAEDPSSDNDESGAAFNSASSSRRDNAARRLISQTDVSPRDAFSLFKTRPPP